MKFLCDRCKTRYSISDDRVCGKILKIRCKNCANVITVREGMTADAADPPGLRKRGTTQIVPAVGNAPPAALEQAWYMSLDGQQEGPFSLAEAQRWVGDKAFDAELHCWSEGFDDWLPVDKVSHFRGLRKKPIPPPPPPRTSAPVRAIAPSAEPQPLFVATMAAIERDAASAPAAFPMPAATATLRSFDLGVDESVAGVNDRFAKALGAEPDPMPAATPAPSTMATVPAVDDDSDDDDLSIGEVSRVVNLADLKPRAKTAAEPALRPALNRTGTVPRLGNTAAVPRIYDRNAPLVIAGPNVTSTRHVDASHRRGVLLLGAAAVVLVGCVVVVALLVFGGGSEPLSGLGHTDDIDTTRPDDPQRKIELGQGSGLSAGSQTTAQPKKPNIGTASRPQTGVPTKDPDPPVGGNRISGDEIEAMARTQSAGTQRCYMRAQRGAEAILLGDVKKVSATLTIGPDGKVTAVELDKAADSSFGKCLISTIGGWKFRASPGGTYKIALQFVSS